MELQLHRFSENGTDTLGLMSIDCEFECFTLEDEYRKEKVKGETRIPSGRYEVKFREEVTGLTQKYRDKYPWFTFHLHLQDVKGFKYVYMHVGNEEDHSEGCILVADQSDNTVDHEGKRHIYKSVQGYERFYKKVWNTLHDGEQVFITIKDRGEWD